MEPLAALTGVIYMYKKGHVPTEAEYEWRMIGVYNFAGASCSPSYTLTGGAGIYTGAAGLITTDAIAVRIVARTGYWYDGLSTKYRGMMDAKTKVSVRHVGNDWTGSFQGFNTAPEAAAYWLTVSAEIEIGTDRVFSWGGYHVNPSVNTGSLTFSLLGKFLR
jgi:hypothetical protein